MASSTMVQSQASLIKIQMIGQFSRSAGVEVINIDLPHLPFVRSLVVFFLRLI